MCCNESNDDLYNRMPAFYASTARTRTVMMNLLLHFVEIALLRRGPQDLPASSFLLTVTVLGYLAVNVLARFLMPAAQGAWMLQLLFELLFTLGWYALLLRIFNRPERFLQTATAMFGYQTLLAPPIIAAIWLVQQFGKESVWLLPVLVIALVLVVWLIAAGAHILKAALEWSMPASVGMIILQMVVGELLLLGLFAPSP